MRLSRHFTLEELTSSQEAVRRGISNKPGKGAVERLALLAQELDKVRDALGVPVTVSSAYRSPALNKAVKGSAGSWHCQAQAADIIAPRYGTPLEICRFIDQLMLAGEIRVHEVIHEFGSWCHLAIALPDEAPDGERLTYDFHNGKKRCRAGLLEVA